ncbi:MAG: hypothetical protein LBE35_06455 [Clostridiales bacterium]|jgi:hypothetical protein|nr:hypothetical protein [Clostridiales bacterium]
MTTLREITDREIMTTREAMEKYTDNYFFWVTTKIVDWADNDLGFVAYIADNREDLQVDRSQFRGYDVGYLEGYSADKNIYVGGLVLERVDGS